MIIHAEQESTIRVPSASPKLPKMDSAKGKLETFFTSLYLTKTRILLLKSNPKNSMQKVAPILLIMSSGQNSTL